MFEVEQKFRLSNPAAVASRLAERGALLSEPQLQVDRYFNHPARDFAESDEALRIRQVGEKNYLTYKGPKIDATTKTRREIELPIAPGAAAADRFAELLIALGFQAVASVRKHRRKATLDHANREIEIVLDEVDQVGTYIELESAAEEGAVNSAKRAIASLADELGLTDNERKSYLELLLERR